MVNYKLFKRGLLIIPLFFLLISGYSQDSHYWTNQFGTRAALLGGAVIGGTPDNSSIYYNPAQIGFIDNKHLGVSANAYEWDKLSMPNGAGSGQGLRSSSIQSLPLIISGVVKLDKYPKHTLGYCMLTKDQSGIKTSARVDDFRDILSNGYSPGAEDYIAEYSLKTSLYDVLAGWGYGYKVNDQLAVGFGNYGSYRSYHYDAFEMVKAIPVDSGVFNTKTSSLTQSQSVELYTVRTFFKGGISLDLGKLKLGLCATSPSIHVYGRSTLLADISLNNCDYFNNGTLIGFTADDRQEDLRAIYKSPASVAIGGSYDWGRTTLCLSLEWFDHVKNYPMVTPENKPFVRPAGSNYLTSDQFLGVVDEKKSILNLVIGIEQKINEVYKLTFSARNNQSYRPIKPSVGGIEITAANWDLYHLCLGVTQKREKSDLSVGVSYGFSLSPQIDQFVNITDTRSDQMLVGNIGKTSANYQSLGLIFGFTHYIK